MLLFNTTKFGIMCYKTTTKQLLVPESGVLWQQNIKQNLVMTLGLGSGE